MGDLIVWLIIVAFYAPLHYMMPALVLFITGSETDEIRRRLILRAVIDSTVSMVVAFALVFALVRAQQMLLAMTILFVSMLYPFLGIWRRRRDIAP